MSAWLPLTRGGPAPDPEHTAWLEPARDLAAVRRRWEVRTAQWRAAALAEAVFGGRVRVALRGGDAASRAPAGGNRFRGLLRLEVPFEDLELHRWRERVFAACAAEDPVLARVPLVFVFSPREAASPVEAGT